MDLWTILVTLLVGVVCIYLFKNVTWNHVHLKKLGVPHVKPLPLFGNMAGVVFRKKLLTDMMNEVYSANPEAKYLGLYDFGSPIILIKDPELVKSIAIKNFDSFPDHKFFSDLTGETLFEKSLFSLKGDTWRRMRALLSPSFTSSKMKMMFKITSECSVDFGESIASLDPLPEAMDMKDVFGRYSIDVIATTAFGLSINSIKNPDNEFYRMATRLAFSNTRMSKYLLVKSFPWFARLINLKLLDVEATEYLENVVRDAVAARDERGIVRQDMLQLLIQARNEDSKISLTNDDLIIQGFAFLVGGSDSPTMTMCFTAQLLALNPDVQRKLQAEIDDVRGRNGGDVSYEELNAMKYMDAVVSETLRLYPPAVAMDRVCVKSFTLPPPLPGAEPVEVKPGETLWIPVHSFHRDPKYFPDPDKFDPERFNDENKSGINPLTYLPFGIGPRMCIANRFALMEVKLVLFHLLARCELLPSSKTRSPIKLGARGLIVMPEEGFWLKIRVR
ncbi:cytochrome P450 9e2-like [Athalia rosae]|uniref:cytochrome P450 9e2-like n=1 Tax=Athalia rosae TaxID=37344 RepID=UPI002033B66C|nr:cytochrome P450 9e2-like [Athalia rosae]